VPLIEAAKKATVRREKEEDPNYNNSSKDVFYKYISITFQK
jgi:hypothetical protein